MVQDRHLGRAQVDVEVCGGIPAAAELDRKGSVLHPLQAIE